MTSRNTATKTHILWALPGHRGMQREIHNYNHIRRLWKHRVVYHHQYCVQVTTGAACYLPGNSSAHKTYSKANSLLCCILTYENLTGPAIWKHLNITFVIITNVLASLFFFSSLFRHTASSVKFLTHNSVVSGQHNGMT